MAAFIEACLTSGNLTDGACADLGGNASLLNLSSAYVNSTFQQMMNEVVEFQYYAWGIAGNVIAALGLLGNMLSIFVLANRRMYSSTSMYLIALSVFDSLVLISLTLFMALPAIYYATGALEVYQRVYPYLQPYAYPIALTAQTCSIYITVGFTIERYIAVCYPLKAAKFCTVERARKAIGIILLGSVVYNIPRWLEYETRLYLDPNTNETYPQYVQTPLGANTTFRHIYFIFMHMFVMLLIPCAVLSVFNALLIRAVKNSARTEGKVTNKQRRENNLTAMLISVVFVFLICQVPSIVDNVFAAVLEDAALQTLPFVKLTVLSSLMVILNSAINFYLYCVFGQKFRRVFCRLFCICCKGERNAGHTSVTLLGHSNGTVVASQKSHSSGGKMSAAAGKRTKSLMRNGGKPRGILGHFRAKTIHGAQAQRMKVGDAAYTAVNSSPALPGKRDLCVETQI